MKKILFIAFLFIHSFFALASKATIDTSKFYSNPFFESVSVNQIELDSSLRYLHIYDPAIYRSYYGLGFPGAACRPLIFNSEKSIGIHPLFNAYVPFLLTTNFQTHFNFKKPITLVQYIIYPSLKTEQYLDLFHSRNINKDFNVGFKIRKVKSNGYYLHQGSNISNVLAYSDFHSSNNRYKLYLKFIYDGIISIENGGVINDSVEFNSKSINLKSMPVNILDAKNRILLYGGSINQSFDFGTSKTIVIDSLTSKTEFIPSSRIQLDFDYTKHATTYLDADPLSGFYENTFKDSIDTFDKLSHENYKSQLSYTTLENKRSGNKRFLLTCFGISNEYSVLERKELIKTFDNTSTFLDFRSNSTSDYRLNLSGNYFFEGYNSKNYEAELLVGKRFLDSSSYSFISDLIFNFSKRNQDYVFQNYYSNHFIWTNNFDALTTKSINFWLRSKVIANLNLKYESLDGWVYLDSNSRPARSANEIKFFSGRLCKLIEIGEFFIDANIIYQKVLSGNDVFLLPDWYTRNSVYWKSKVFKNALDLQIGLDLLYTSKYYGQAYQPSLNAFYYQNKKEVGGYPSFDLFVNFKIRQARLFFKVDHLNYGWSSGKSEYVPNYLMPGRTFRFGLNWLFTN